MARGGVRTPASPSPVSGPGALSRRTDGGPAQPIRDPGGLPYGENQELRTVQGAAPMNKSNSPVQAARGTGGGQTGAALVPFNAPTQRPDEPVTEGNPRGPGGGPEALSTPLTFRQASSRDGETLKKYLPALERVANMPNTPPSFVRFFRQLRDM